MNIDQELDQIDELIDTDPIELARRYRKALRDLHNERLKVQEVMARVATLHHILFDS